MFCGLQFKTIELLRRGCIMETINGFSLILLRGIFSLKYIFFQTHYVKSIHRQLVLSCGEFLAIGDLAFVLR